MTWALLQNDKYKTVAKEINKQRDRGAAIIASSVLEDHLLVAIKAKLISNEPIENKVFKGYGPLASFSARIDLGMLLGLYEIETHKTLHRIRDIRNEFAHNLGPISFRSQRIRDLCAHFALPRGAARGFHKDFDKFMKTGTVVQGDPNLLQASKIRLSFFYRSTNPRTQYIRAVQRITWSLALTATALQITKKKARAD